MISYSKTYYIECIYLEKHRVRVITVGDTIEAVKMQDVIRNRAINGQEGHF